MNTTRFGLAALLVVGLLAVLAGCSRESEQPNIVVIVLDTMRRDVAGWPDEATPAPLRSAHLTPNLDAFGAEGVTFTRAFSAAPWTVPSHASMMTGQLPSGHTCVSLRPRLGEDKPTFAEHLGRLGYDTAAYFSNPWLTSKATNVLRGFDVQRVSKISGMFELMSRTGDQGGRESVTNLDGWLEQRSDDAPFLLFVNLLESHLSYDPPEDYRRDHLSDLPAGDAVSIDWSHEYQARLHPRNRVDWSRVERLYAGDVWSADRYLGQILKSLEEHGLDENTVVIVTSDHGENLGDHDLVEHQFSVHETLLAVPLVIRVPEGLRQDFDLGAPVGGRRDDPAMTTDLYATVLDLAGAMDVARPPFSRSWLQSPASHDRAVYAEYAGPPPGLLEHLQSLNPGADLSRLQGARGTVRVGNLRLSAVDSGGIWLHDMDADPFQRHNLAESRPEAVQALMPLLMRASRPLPEGAEPVEMDEATKRQLESLGYIN